ncbi:MAG: hypothetical protein SVV88_11650 [Pseudomonadota bacterium]|nr:hypothetical protein [Pseudomonadota bacterium]
MSEESQQDNYVTLEPGKPVRMHFIDHQFMQKKITDPVLKWPKVVNSLVFQVSKLNDLPVETIFSLISKSAIDEITPYLAGKKYTNYDFIYVKDGPEFTPPRIVQVDTRR